MQDLFEVTKENVLLGVLSGTQVLYLEKIMGRNSAPALTRSGGTLPAYATAIGKVLLAHGPDEIRDRVCARELRQYTESTIRDGAALRRELELVRLRGYAVADQELRRSRVAVAAPVLNHIGVAVAGISVMGHAHTIDLDRLAPAVQPRRSHCLANLGSGHNHDEAALLADRVVVMGANPGRTLRTIDVPTHGPGPSTRLPIPTSLLSAMTS